MFDTALHILIVILSFSLLLCFVRLYLGPNVPNRTAAFDVIALHSVGMIVLFAVRSDSPALLDVAIVTAALGFLGTTMIAQYLERGAGRGWLDGGHAVDEPADTVMATPLDEGAQDRSQLMVAQETGDSSDANSNSDADPGSVGGPETRQ